MRRRRWPPPPQALVHIGGSLRGTSKAFAGLGITLGVKNMSREVMVCGGPSSLRQVISVGQHQFFVDEPKASGGSDQGPDPYELLLSALGSCTNMTLRMYADRKGWPLKEIRVVLTHSKNYSKDCVNCEQPAAMIDRIERRITLIGELSAEQRQKLLVIANLCPVHKTLTSGIDVQTQLVAPVAVTDSRSET